MRANLLDDMKIEAADKRNLATARACLREAIRELKKLREERNLFREAWHSAERELKSAGNRVGEQDRNETTKSL